MCLTDTDKDLNKFIIPPAEKKPEYLRRRPTRRLGFHCAMPDDMVASMEGEILLETEATHKSREGKTKKEKREIIASIRGQIQKRYRDKHYDVGRNREIAQLSLSITNMLKTRGINIERDEKIKMAAMEEFLKNAELSVYPELNASSCLYLGEAVPSIPIKSPEVVGPNTYFEMTQFWMVREYGYPFFTTLCAPADPPSSTQQREGRILDINVNFFAAFLGGDKRFLHDVIYYIPEKRFYFYDPFDTYYLPTTEDKLFFGLSQTIQRLCWGLEAGQAQYILSQFRNKTFLNELLVKAKALLGTEAGFFGGPDAKVRYVLNDIHASNYISTVQKFVEQHIVKDEGCILTFSEIVAGLESFARATEYSLPDPKEIKNQLLKVIRQIHGKGIRNDNTLDDGRHVKGWKGLRMRAEMTNGEFLVQEVAESADPDRSDGSVTLLNNALTPQSHDMALLN